MFRTTQRVSLARTSPRARIPGGRGDEAGRVRRLAAAAAYFFVFAGVFAGDFDGAFGVTRPRYSSSGPTSGFLP